MNDFKSILYEIIGDRIKAKRKELGLNQIDLANSLKVARSSISNIEIGRHQIPLHLLYELCALLKVSISDILPTQEEIMQVVNSGLGDYAHYLQSRSYLDADEIKNVSDIIKNIGQNDK